ncbi:MAG: hypothetical protein ACXV96_08220 [Candidatus Angelobacter sp.]
MEIIVGNAEAIVAAALMPGTVFGFPAAGAVLLPCVPLCAFLFTLLWRRAPLLNMLPALALLLKLRMLPALALLPLLSMLLLGLRLLLVLALTFILMFLLCVAKSCGSEQHK